MDKKKILIISRAYFPTVSPRSNRTTELAEEFARQGHEVVVYFPFNGYDYSSYSKANNITVKNLGNLKFPTFSDNGNHIIRYIKKGISMLLLLLFDYPAIEFLFMVSKILKSEKNYDLLISVAMPYPIHWGVALKRTKKNPIAKKWIADCGDPYMGERTNRIRRLFYFKYVEKWSFKRADFITIPIESARKAYYPEFYEKIKIIPQGISFNKIELSPYTKNEIFPTFCYAGSFIPGLRDPRSFLDYLSKINKPFKFIIYTTMPDILKPYDLLLKGKLEIRNYIPRMKLLYEMSRMDFIVNFDNNTTVHSPSKLIDYCLTKRPVLNIKSQMDNELIDEFFSADYRRSLKIDNIQQYNIENIARQFIALSDQ